MTCFGWTWEYIDDFMTIPRLKEIAKFHKLNPPQHLLLISIARYWGITGPEDSKIEKSGLDENGASLFDVVQQQG